MKRNCWLLIFIALSFFSKAQKPEEILTQWAHRSPIEKIYLHFDRDNYIAGETAWFKAYLYSDYLPDTISTDIYAELIKEKDLVLDRKVLPVIFSTAHGQFEIPDTLVSGYYTIRAYTPTMLNHDQGFIYQRSIFIYGKKDKNQLSGDTEKQIRLEFFPEGGNFVQGLPNTIAFKASDEKGLPIVFNGQVKDEKAQIIAVVNTIHDGMGMFELTPLAGSQYHVVQDEATSGKKFYLPASTEKGVVLTVIPHPLGSFFEIKQHSGDPTNQAAYMIGQMQHHIVFRQQFGGAQQEVQGVINTQNLHSGILQITVFNKEGLPLAERLSFVDNKEYMQEVALVTDTINFSKRGRNRFSLQFRDTVKGSFSVAVTDPDQDLSAAREENIISRFLLSSDLQGYIHNPAWYFSSNDDSVKNDLDLVMMTNGWRRFRWAQLLKKNETALTYSDPAFITLAGKATVRGTRKPFAFKQVLVFITGPEKKRIIQFAFTDKDGNFRIDSLLFFGMARLLFSDIKGKKSQYIDILLTPDSLNRSFELPPVDISSVNKTITLPSAYQSNAGLDYDAIRNANGLLLENVTVRVTKKTPLEQVEERYTTGAFAGDATRTFDLVNNDEAEVYENIFDFLQTRVNGLQVSREGAEYNLYYRQGIGTGSSLGLIPMTLYLDEIQTDASFISSVPAHQVALVKIYSSFIGATGNAPGGVLAIYTKKGGDFIKKNGFASLSFYQGYSVIREFYAPDYQVKKEENKADNRVTIDWRPDILSNYINPSIPFSFYNNDRTKRFKIVVEGMTSSGKMICLEKIITGK